MWHRSRHDHLFLTTCIHVLFDLHLSKERPLLDNRKNGLTRAFKCYCLFRVASVQVRRWFFKPSMQQIIPGRGTIPGQNHSWMWKEWTHWCDESWRALDYCDINLETPRFLFRSSESWSPTQFSEMSSPLQFLENATENRTTRSQRDFYEASNRISLSSASGVFLMCIYIAVYLTSTIGNSLVLSACFSTGRKPRRLSVFEGISSGSPAAFFSRYIASLSAADLIFTQLTALDVAYAIQGEWVTGQAVCKLQGFLLETCYSASILTLLAISRERLRSVTSRGMKSLRQRDRDTKLFTLSAWIGATLLCSPVLYAYSTVMTVEGRTLCTNRGWGDLARRVYYCVMTFILFAIPLFIMIKTHVRLRDAFRAQVVPSDCITASRRRKQTKAIRMLGVVTFAFLLCWSPFLVIRTLRYFHLYEGEMAWKLSQLIVISSAAVNPFIYGTYNANFRAHFKKSFQRFWCWNCDRFGARETSVVPSVSQELTRPHMLNCYEAVNGMSPKTDCQISVQL